MRSVPALVATCLVAASGGGIAQPVYRCGSSYSHQPCAGGTAVAAPAGVPDKADAARAAGAARIDAQRAAALEKARLEQERKAPKAVVMAAPAKPAASAKPAPPMRKPQEFKAVAKTGGMKK